MCTGQCERNAAEKRASGCNAELESFERCMSSQHRWQGRDYDAMHIAEVCRTQGEALTACEKRDGGPSEGGPGCSRLLCDVVSVPLAPTEATACLFQQVRLLP